MHKQRLVLLICCLVGIVATFLPWVNVPFISVSGTAGDGWFGLGAFAIGLIISLVGKTNESLSAEQFVISAFSLLGASVLYGWKLYGVSKIAKETIADLADNPFADLAEGMFQNIIGTGLYVGLVAGVLGLILIVVLNPAPSDSSDGLTGDGSTT